MTSKSQGIILIVADDTTFPPPLIESLRRAKFETVIWSASSWDTEAALPTLDIILLDGALIETNDDNGDERQPQWPTKERFVDAPIICLGEPSPAMSGVDLNIVDFLYPPFQPEAIIAQIARHITRQQRDRDFAAKERQQTQEIAVGKSIVAALRRSETLLNDTQKLAKVGGWEIDLETYHITVWVQARGQAIYREGKAVKMSGTLQDITARKESELALQQANADLAGINRITQTLASTLDFETMLNMVIKELVKLFKADTSGVALLNANRTELRVVAEYTVLPDTPSAVGLVFPLADNPFSVQIIESGKPGMLWHDPFLGAGQRFRPERGSPEPSIHRIYPPG